jgi:hypothetical protein
VSTPSSVFFAGTPGVCKGGGRPGGGGRGRAGRTGAWGTRTCRWGTITRPSSSATRSTWRLQRRWATGRGGQGALAPRVRVFFAEGLCEGLRVPDVVPGDCKGGGRRVGDSGLWEPRECVPGAGGLFQGDREPHKVPGDGKGGGRTGRRRHNSCLSQGDFSKAIEYHAQHLAIAKEVGDWAGEGRA